MSPMKHHAAPELEPRQDAELESYTRDVLAAGIEADILRSTCATQCAQAPGTSIHVQVDRTRSAELSESLRQLVSDPSTVAVTDARGKAVPLRIGMTHEELAELVCLNGCSLHIKPEGDRGHAAATLASNTNGLVRIPGQPPMSAQSIANELITSLRQGDLSPLENLAREFERLGLANVSEPSRALHGALRGEHLAGVTDAWQLCMESLLAQWRQHGVITIAPMAEHTSPGAPLVESNLDQASADAIMVNANQQDVYLAEGTLTGTGKGMELLEFSQFLHINGRTGCLTLNDGTPRHTSIWFRNGDLVHALSLNGSGLAATEGLLPTEGEAVPFVFTPDVEADVETVTTSTPMLLLDLSRQMDETSAQNAAS